MLCYRRVELRFMVAAFTIYNEDFTIMHSNIILNQIGVKMGWFENKKIDE